MPIQSSFDATINNRYVVQAISLSKALSWSALSCSFTQAVVDQPRNPKSLKSLQHFGHMLVSTCSSQLLSRRAPGTGATGGEELHRLEPKLAWESREKDKYKERQLHGEKS